MTTGMISPSWSLAEVLALKPLQNSMILTPCGPSAVPTGGAGVAFPAGICSFTEPVIFFAMTKFSFTYTKAPVTRSTSGTLCGLFDLQEVQFHRGRAAKNRDQHAQRIALRIDLVHLALEVRERAVDDAHRFALFERHLRTRTLRRRRLAIEHLVDLIRAQGHRSLPAAHESG